MKITVSSKEFQTFIHALNQLDSEGTSLLIYKDRIETLVIPTDNLLIFYGRVNILNFEDINLKEGEFKRINIRDLTKFQRLLDNNNEDTFTFTIKNNYIVYSGSFIKNAKFVLNENPPKTVNKRITVDWFNQFNMTFKSSVKKDVIKRLIQLGSFTGLSETKAYFSTESGEFIADLNDRNKSNVDSVAIKLSDAFEGSIEQSIIPLIALTKLTLGTDDIIIESANISKGAVSNETLFITISFDNVYLKYMLNCKKS